MYSIVLSQPFRQARKLPSHCCPHSLSWIWQKKCVKKWTWIGAELSFSGSSILISLHSVGSFYLWHKVWVGCPSNEKLKTAIFLCHKCITGIRTFLLMQIFNVDGTSLSFILFITKYLYTYNNSKLYISFFSFLCYTLHMSSHIGCLTIMCLSIGVIPYYFI